MGLHILIAEPRDILRVGIRTILMQDQRVELTHEAITESEMQNLLRTEVLDLVIVNWSLITNYRLLPRGRFVILAAELDLQIFQEAYKYGAKGYLLETSPTELLHVALNLSNGSFLLEPTMAGQIIEHINMDPRLLIKEELLTPREKEIVTLLKEGAEKIAIAKRRNMSLATPNTHIKNMTKKSSVSS